VSQPTELLDIIRAHASRTPSAPALIDGATGKVASYEELAAGIPTSDTAPTLTFVIMRESVAHARAYVEALCGPGAVALLDPATASDRFAALLEAYRPDVVLGLAQDLKALSLSVTADGRDGSLAASATGATGGAAQSLHPDLALLLSTSGSTGSPKLVRLSAANVASNAAGIAKALAIEPDDRAITCLPMHYTYGLSILSSHLAAGAATICTPAAPLDPVFWDCFREYEATTLAGVPFSYRMYDRLKVLENPPPTLRSMTQAGGKLDAASIERYARGLREQGRRFYVMYGQTEATARMSILPYDLATEHPDTAGFPVPGGSFSIDHSHLDEVVFRGPNVMMGYATTRADLSTGDELGGVLRTGDVGQLTPEGLLRITGRIKRIAKLSGVRVSLDDVEAAAAPFRRAAAVAVTGTDKITLVVEGSVDDERGLRRSVAHAAGIAARDLAVVSVDELPTGASGKIDYARLERLL
jgi:acyl-CoA synthetase (AMP-forming)/AMP-acid ligase II